MYEEILLLYEYCKKIGVSATLSLLFDGFKITFEDGGDVVQHCYSYGSRLGRVEVAIGSKFDYLPISLEHAKHLIDRRNKK